MSNHEYMRDVMVGIHSQSLRISQHRSYVRFMVYARFAIVTCNSRSWFVSICVRRGGIECVCIGSVRLVADEFQFRVKVICHQHAYNCYTFVVMQKLRYSRVIP